MHFLSLINFSPGKSLSRAEADSASRMATSFAPVALSAGGSHLNERQLWSMRTNFIGNLPSLKTQRKSVGANRKLSVCAQYTDNNRGGGGGDFVAGFLLGGAVFGTLSYIFAPQIRRSLLNEDEYGFRKAKRPIYYDDGLEKTRQTLNAKISQLNSAIDNVSSRLRGGNKSPPIPIETDPEIEAAI